MNTKRILGTLSILAAISLFASACASHHFVVCEVADAHRIAESPLVRDQAGRIVVDLAVNGKTFRLALDESSGTELSATSASLLGLQSVDQTVALHAASIEGKVLDHFVVRIVQKNFSTDVDGILGSDFLADNALEIDEIHQVVRFHLGMTTVGPRLCSISGLTLAM